MPLSYDLHIQSHFYSIHQSVIFPLTSSSFNLKWWSLYKFNNHINLVTVACNYDPCNRLKRANRRVEQGGQ